mmetsp:Transcript_56249/g.150281  ORF Transcript_56249/g.150281 Transcript_56249/m.150281 type:complete len:219 (-) Transcript_56249:7-663(-)
MDPSNQSSSRSACSWCCADDMSRPPACCDLANHPHSSKCDDAEKNQRRTAANRSPAQTCRPVHGRQVSNTVCRGGDAPVAVAPPTSEVAGSSSSQTPCSVHQSPRTRPHRLRISCTPQAIHHRTRICQAARSCDPILFVGSASLHGPSYGCCDTLWTDPDLIFRSSCFRVSQCSSHAGASGRRSPGASTHVPSLARSARQHEVAPLQRPQQLQWAPLA